MKRTTKWLFKFQMSKLALVALMLVLTSLLAACGNDTPSSATTTAAQTTISTSTTVATPAQTTGPSTTTAPTQPASTTAAQTTTQPASTTTAAQTTTQPASTTTVAQTTASAGQGQTEPLFEDRTSPANLVKAFYNAIDRKEYQRAYGYWQNTGTTNTPASYDQFAKGYADTASVAFTLGTITSDAGAGNIRASIPTVLVATHTNGKQETFAGCYVAHRVNDGISSNPADVLWRFESGKLAAASPGTKPDAASCNPAQANPGPATFQDRTSPENLIKAFYNAVDNKEYQRAYSYWQNPGKGDANTPASFDQFAKGYSDTVNVAYTLGQVTTNAGAGNIYASIPIVLTATHTNGTKTSFAGCYVAHRVNDGISSNPDDTLWRLVSGKLAAAQANAQPDPKSCPQ